MRKAKAILFVDEYKARRRLYLKQEECDAYILMEGKVMGFHKQFLRDSSLLNKQFVEENRKIYLLQDNANPLVLYKVIGCLYGLECCFERNWEVLQIYGTIVKLEIKVLKAMMEADFRNSFDEYGFFVLFTIAFKFSIDWLQALCREQLLFFGFEQLNFNRSDFLQCQKFVPEILIQIYREFSGAPKLIPKEKVKNIINFYCRANGLKVQVNYLLLTEIENIIVESDSQESVVDYLDRHLTKINLGGSYNQTCASSKNMKDQDSQKQGRKVIGTEENIKGSKQSEENASQNNQSPEKSQSEANELLDVTFSNVCNYAEDNFLEKKKKSQKKKKEKPQQKRVHRSTSPPASPWTPQFGQFIKVKKHPTEKKKTDHKTTTKKQ